MRIKTKNKTYCVYEHISPSGKHYIGITSMSPNKRWANGKGYLTGTQPLFQKAILKYGWNNIIHNIILRDISEQEAKYAEKYLIRWYKLHKLSYNITDGGETISKKAIRKGKDNPMYGRHETNPMYGIKGKDNPNSIKVYQYSRNGKFIKEWGSIIDAARTFDNPSSAATTITACCKGKLPATKGYIWRYFYTEKLNETAPSHIKTIYQYDVDGSFIASYTKIKDLMEVFNVPKNRVGIVSSCCSGKGISAFGYFWSWVKYEKYDISNVKPQVITKMKKEQHRQKAKTDARLKEKQINSRPKTTKK